MSLVSRAQASVRPLSRLIELVCSPADALAYETGYFYPILVEEHRSRQWQSRVRVLLQREGLRGPQPGGQGRVRWLWEREGYRECPVSDVWLAASMESGALFQQPLETFKGWRVGDLLTYCLPCGPAGSASAFGAASSNWAWRRAA